MMGLIIEKGIIKTITFSEKCYKAYENLQDAPPDEYLTANGTHYPMST